MYQTRCISFLTHLSSSKEDLGLPELIFVRILQMLRQYPVAGPFDVAAVNLFVGTEKAIPAQEHLSHSTNPNHSTFIPVGSVKCFNHAMID
jgi:hypothetical protein